MPYRRRPPHAAPNRSACGRRGPAHCLRGASSSAAAAPWPSMTRSSSLAPSAVRAATRMTTCSPRRRCRRAAALQGLVATDGRGRLGGCEGARHCARAHRCGHLTQRARQHHANAPPPLGQARRRRGARCAPLGPGRRARPRPRPPARGWAPPAGRAPAARRARARPPGSARWSRQSRSWRWPPCRPATASPPRRPGTVGRFSAAAAPMPGAGHRHCPTPAVLPGSADGAGQRPMCTAQSATGVCGMAAASAGY